MIRHSKAAYGVALAYSRGYRAVDGGVISPRGLALKLGACGKGNHYYKYFAIKTGYDKTNVVVKVHILVAYQKFGLDAIRVGTCVRHLDGDTFNNLEQNIEIGTLKDNQADVPQHVNRRRVAAMNLARRARRALSVESVVSLRRDRSNGMSWKDISKKYGISVNNAREIGLGKRYRDVPMTPG
jgi:hypothetical protein